MENFFILIILVSPALFVLTALSSIFQRGVNPVGVMRLSRLSMIWGLIAAGIAIFQLATSGAFETTTIGFRELGVSLRFDVISVMMISLIALLSFIVLRYSFNYLEGDARHGSFLGRMAAAIASVQLLVLSGNLGILALSWILTSISLHRLLLFYPERIGAKIAARKKFIMARLSDACLLVAIVILYREFNTGNLEVIFDSIKTSGVSQSFEGWKIAAIFLVCAALFKSVQFPFHGWLVEVMETPTPVSALLHAGLLNAGPFLIIRFSYLMESIPATSILLIVFGGITALYGSITYMTQSSIKTALSYSSIAHMGFSLLISGLGGFSAGMLHLVGHSFYKAHAFLSSGSTIDTFRVTRNTNLKRSVNPIRIIASFLLASILFVALMTQFGINPEKEPAILFIGIVIILGTTRLVASGLNAEGSGYLLRILPVAFGITLAFFVLESLFGSMIDSQTPASQLTPAAFILAGTMLGVFVLIVLIQIITPDLSQRKALKAASIHLKNGLYINAFLDRFIGAWNVSKTTKKSFEHNIAATEITLNKVTENQTA